LQTLNLDRLQQFLDWNRLDKSKVITMNSLYWGGIVTSCKVGVKLLGNVSVVCVIAVLIWFVCKATEREIQAQNRH